MIRKLLFCVISSIVFFDLPAGAQPNVVLIYADDLGLGDISGYGSQHFETPNLDRLIKKGLQFTNGHSTSSVCTPSRYAMMTGRYPWRQQGTGILPGDAALIIPQGQITLPELFRQAGYRTGIVGKWHLGLGNEVSKNWNEEVRPGPQETGFDYSFIFPATADRVPTVFMENGRVVGLDPNDPITVNYQKKVGADPTGLENPELLKLLSHHGHNNTIVNGIGRIGFMSGGKMARWTDEELPLTFLQKAKDYIAAQRAHPFFLFYALTEPHVPRMPSTMFKGKSGYGARGDAILQLDWAVGEIVKELERNGLTKKTLIIFSSDNGPVLNDGYYDASPEMYKAQNPTGPVRGGKFSIFEGGTRVPFIISWPGKIKPGVTDALVCQMDFLASFSALLKRRIPPGEAPDSENVLNALTGKSKQGRRILVEHTPGLAIIKEDWKYIRPNKGVAVAASTKIETGNSATPQLYNLKEDLKETNNLASKFPEKVNELELLLQQIQDRQ